MTAIAERSTAQTMSVTASWFVWQSAIKHASTVMSKRPTMPILAYAMVTTTADCRVVLTVTDLEVFSRRTLFATADGDDVLLLPIYLVLAALKGVKGTMTPAKAKTVPVTIARENEHLTVSGFGRVLRIDDSLPDVRDFPSWPTGATTPALTIAADVWQSAFKFAAVGAGRDYTLPMLTGVKVESGDGAVTFATTDRYRLAVTDAACDVHAPLDVLVPATAQTALSALTGTVRVSTYGGDSQALCFEDGDGTIVVRLLDATFPKYRSLIPEVEDMRIVDRVVLLDDVAAAATVSDRGPVRITLAPDVLTVAGCSPVSAIGSDSEYTIAFNPAFLSDGLKAFTGQTVTFGGLFAGKPHMIRGERPGGTGMYLIMPVRIPQ